MAHGNLDIHFEGYFMCRIATDPDPTNEERGMSGYTMALVNEDPLDQVIRLQADKKWLKRNARPPLPDMKIEVGVKVKSVLFNGVPYDKADKIVGAKVYLDGVDFPLPGPTFESRNSTVGSDDSFAFVVNPFILRIQKDESIKLTATDYIDPKHPKLALWQVNDPAVYSRRLANCASTGDTEAAEAVHVFDAFGYFRDRKRYLEKLIRDTEAACADPSKSEKEINRFKAEIECYKSRIYQLEHWGDRVISKIQTRVGWEHDINGPQKAKGDLGGSIDTSIPWHVKYWFGSWDGDLLLGYMRGTLSVPFTIDAR